MTQAIGGAGVQVGFGWLGMAPFGLLLGQMINSGAGIAGLGRDFFREDRNKLPSLSFNGMRKMFHAYDRFPKYSTFEGLANTAGIQLPVIIIAALAVGPEAGYLMLATRAMAAPMTLIGSSVAQVYLSRAPEELRRDSLGEFTAKVIGGLAKSGVGPLIFAGIISPVAFPIIFGEEWRRAGDIVGWMTPWFVAQFLASPVSMTLHVTGHQRRALVLQLFGVIVRVGAVLLAAKFAADDVVEIYAVSGFLFYLVYVYVVVIVSGMRLQRLIAVLREALPWVAIWTTTALACRAAIAFL
ncbi:hypothetical protein GCM10008098_20670 [Rhodanobacter panaciterrae]|uniref:Polysaccharide biosynthesis protein n=2 Tax=Rhodanobacter panaciterrae TaxID=490572 RepID=A0ABQ2ZVS4_9GAMM|nr:hypothetical protein GCM10008098_20670 [Rhodanobacter panaciterrae]